MASGLSRLSLSLLSAALLLAGCAIAAPPADSTGQLVTFRVAGQPQLDALLSTGAYDIVQVKGDRVVAIRQQNATGANAARELQSAEASLLDLRTLMEDVDDQLASFKAKGSEGAYHSYAEAVAELNDLATRYPELLKTEVLGKSAEGRDLLAVRLTGKSETDAAKPRVLIFGLTHAREWISTEVPFHVLNHLLANYGKDPAVTGIVDGLVLYILPITNPDGLVYSQTKYKMWRKNRNPQGRDVGVDINRNFPIGWGLGSSAYPSADTYRGPEPASELETRALISLFEREKFIAALSFHSYSELVLYSWGYDRALAPDSAELARRAKAMADLNGYTPGQVSRILYIAGGGSDDTFYKTYGAWAFTFELGQEFVPSEDEIPTICKQNLPSVMKFLQTALETARPTPGLSALESLRVKHFFGLYDIRPAH